jgi:phosphatidylethanolamine/phosphatidyl-N-methylethanolamine N-methyltransferase
MDIHAVQKSYARWAPVYDNTFGRVTQRGRREAVAYVNARGGSVLEVGVGTGLSLPHYAASVEVTGIDYSEEMLAKARRKVHERGLTHVKSLMRMDAQSLTLSNDSFDTVVAMHVMSVVPDPEQVLSEMTRVCKSGGIVLITNHFARKTGLLATIEKVSAPLSDLLGWHSDFCISRVMGEASLKLVQQRTFPPFDMMTLLVFRKST